MSILFELKKALEKIKQANDGLLSFVLNKSIKNDENWDAEWLRLVENGGLLNRDEFDARNIVYGLIDRDKHQFIEYTINELNAKKNLNNFFLYTLGSAKINSIKCVYNMLDVEQKEFFGKTFFPNSMGSLHLYSIFLYEDIYDFLKEKKLIPNLNPYLTKIIPDITEQNEKLYFEKIIPDFLTYDKDKKFSLISYIRGIEDLNFAKTNKNFDYYKEKIINTFINTLNMFEMDSVFFENIERIWVIDEFLLKPALEIIKKNIGLYDLNNKSHVEFLKSAVYLRGAACLYIEPETIKAIALDDDIFTAHFFKNESVSAEQIKKLINYFKELDISLQSSFLKSVFINKKNKQNNDDKTLDMLVDEMEKQNFYFTPDILDIKDKLKSYNSAVDYKINKLIDKSEKYIYESVIKPDDELKTKNRVRI
jgi:hypothetical protein